MKIAFTGKGGVGKTTIAGLFIKLLAGEGREILAVDCDPDANLGRAIGFQNAQTITPIVRMKEMINERMGVTEGDRTFFKLNPHIADIPDTFARVQGAIKLIVMGAVEEGGAGCMCPENTFLKTLLSHLITKRGEDVVMDMEAGLEHLGRGTTESCDFVIVVAEPSVNAVETAKRIRLLADDVGLKKVYVVANKVRRPRDREFVERSVAPLKVIAAVPFTETFLDTDKENDVALHDTAVHSALEEMNGVLKEDMS